MSFQASTYVVQDACYPRYEYSARHVTTMYKRYRVLLKDLQLEKDLEIPAYGHPEIYVVKNSKASWFIQTKDLMQPNKYEVEAVTQTQTIQFKDIDKLVNENQITGVSAKVIVKELNDVHEDMEQWIKYPDNVILVAKDDTMINEIKRKLSTADNGITLSTTETLGKDICFLLERIVFRKLSELVPDLKCLSGVAKRECIARGFENGMAKSAKQVLKDVVYFEAWMKEMDPETSSTSTKQTWETTPKVAVTQTAELAADSQHTMKEDSTVNVRSKFAAYMLLMAKQHTNWCYESLPSSFRCMLPEDVQQKAVLSGETFDKILVHFSADLRKRVPDESSPDNVDSFRKVFWTARKDIVSVLTSLVSHEGTFKVDDWIALIRKEEETSIKRMLWEITGMYNRSKVPEAERPKSPCFQGHKLNEKAAQHLFNTVVTAKGIGYRCDKLHIFVDEVKDDQRHKQNKQIREALAKYHITDYTISTTTKIVQHYKRVGAKIKVARSGTLGGFAHMGENKQLCALLSKHVVNGAKLLYWVKNGQQVEIGSMIEARGQQEENNNPVNEEETSEEMVFVDVAAAQILPTQEDQCDTCFRDSKGRRRPCSLYEEHDVYYLAGLPVHIRGATTQLGHGTITTPNLYVPGMQEMTRLILIEDIREDNGDIVRFSQEGDSGAVICADSPEGDSVDVISMLIGIRNWEEVEVNSLTIGQYMTFRMDHGLRELEREYRQTFTLVNS